MELDEIVKLADESEPEVTDEGKGAEKTEQKAAAQEPKEPSPEPSAPQTPSATHDGVSRQEFNTLVQMMNHLAQQRQQQGAGQPQNRPEPWKPDPVDNPDDLAVDGRRMSEHWNSQLAKLAQHLEQNTGQGMGYLAQMVENLGRQVETLSAGSGATARAKAKEIVAEMGFDDFDELAADAEAMLSQQPQLKANPDAWKEAYFMARVRAGKPMRAEPKSAPPPSLGAKPPERPNQRNVDFS
ncbi:MAG TPA: hypothetical protein VLV83_16895, partial [Acidobacteriota bacterium]|nr:hypothetical protein [Acidobacteriota bacterium]